MKTRVFILSIAAVLLAVPAAHADTFFLSTGGKIEGDLLNRNENPRTTFVVTTGVGSITLSAETVLRVEEKSQARKDYEKMLPAMSDNAVDHWKMSVWCQKNGLKEERALHLEKVLKHNPNHEQARHGLGYSKVNGKWVIMEEHNIAQGLVRHRGDWWFPQDVAISINSKNYKEKAGSWRKNLRMWRGWLGKKREAEAVQHFRSIRDPLAAAPLGEMLADERVRAVKIMYIEILGQLNGHSASTALVKQAIEDNDEVVRDRALDQLAEKKAPGVIAVFRRGLKHKEIPKINRAAVGVARMQDTDAIPLLIDALTSTQKFTIGRGNGSPGSVGATFGNGGGGLTAGKKATVVQREVGNESVLNALRHLTGGVDLGFNRKDWDTWYARAGTPQNVDLRRRD